MNSLFWKKAPFTRLIAPFIAGIILQYYQGISPVTVYLIGSFSISILLIFTWFPSFYRFRFYWIKGIVLNIFAGLAGIIITQTNNSETSPSSLNANYSSGNLLVLKIDELSSEKQNSFRTTAIIEVVLAENKSTKIKEKIILYLEKDSLARHLTYGDRIIIKDPPQPIGYTGNPGAFNFRRYCAFQGIYHQAYLKTSSFILLKEKDARWYKQALIIIREKVLSIIRQYIPGKKEYGLASALLIGYKDDLDKQLVKSYANTGVVHVIAISGLHLGIIYWILDYLCKPLSRSSKTRWLKTLLLLAGLWAFSLLAGASPSVLRSALMFSCLVAGDSLERKTSVYNSLAASAFLLLCYNPYWLWDIGFQLSYAAVLSILIFQKPLYNLFFMEKRLPDMLWKMCAITLAAQILTTPVSVFHFHQFPVLFLFCNLLAIPLSSIILIGEIILCVISFIPSLATFIGQLLHWLIYIMNTIIEVTDSISFSVWNSLLISFSQVVLIYLVIIFFSTWIHNRNKPALPAALLCVTAFLLLRNHSFLKAGKQHSMIIYNIPKHQVIDFLSGRKFVSMSDSTISKDQQLQDFHLKPSRILHRISNADSLRCLKFHRDVFMFRNKRIMIINKALRFTVPAKPVDVDIIILSGNPPISIEGLSKLFNTGMVICGSSVPPWKSGKWEVDCRQLHIPFYSIARSGALELRM